MSPNTSNVEKLLHSCCAPTWHYAKIHHVGLRRCCEYDWHSCRRQRQRRETSLADLKRTDAAVAPGAGSEYMYTGLYPNGGNTPTSTIALNHDERRSWPRKERRNGNLHGFGGQDCSNPVRTPGCGSQPSHELMTSTPRLLCVILDMLQVYAKVSHIDTKMTIL